MKQSKQSIGWGMILALFLTTAVLILGSCTTTKYVSVPEVHTDTVRITNHQTDSIWLHDSIYHMVRNDTILIEKWHTKYKEKMVYDTIYQHRIDTIPKPYPVEVKVPRELSWWQRLRIHLGNIMLALIGAAILYTVAKLYIKIKGPL